LTSWRDSASPEAQDQLDELLNVALEVARRALEKRGEFFPFAAVIEKTGELGVAMTSPDDVGEHPPSPLVIARYLDELRQRRDQLQASAIAANATASFGDAVKVDLEHVEGHALTVLVPYKSKRLRRSIEFGALQAEAGTTQVWTGA